MTAKAKTAALPLSGMTVLDLSAVVMGPFCTQILADHGAEVIKVEGPEGDTTRQLPVMAGPGMGAMFTNLNRGKRCIVLDLKTPDGNEAMMRLVRTADVLVYNVRPSAMARLGLAYEQVRAVNPRIVYAGCYGYSEREIAEMSVERKP